MEGISSASITLILLSTIVVIAIGSGITLFLSKKTTSSEDWAMGGRSLPLYVIVFTIFATMVGGGVLVGHVSIGYSFGLAPLSYGICGIIGLLVMAIIAKWLRENEFTTIPDILKKLYGDNKFLMIFSAMMSMVVPFGWIASQITAFAKLYTSITGLNMNLLIVLFAFICMLFTIPAGFKSVAWSDFVFGVMMLILCVITSFQALSMGGGWANIVSKLPDKSIVEFPKGLLAAGIPTTVMWFVAATPGMMTNQMTFQRVCAADTVENARRSLLFSAAIIALLEIWVVIIGVTVRSLNPSIAGEIATGWFLTQIPSWTVALFAGFITTTIITTTDSAIQSVAVNYTQDIYQKYIKPDANDKKVMQVSKISTVVITALAILLAISFPQVLSLIISTYSYAASALLVPIYIGYYLHNKKNLNHMCGLAGMLGGLIGCFIANIIHTKIPYAIYGIAVSFICMMIAVGVTNKNK